MFRPIFMLLVLIFPLAKANSDLMNLEEFYSVFIKSTQFKKTKKDVEFFADHFLKDAKLFIHDYKALINCLDEDQATTHPNDSKGCLKGEVFFKVEFHMNSKKEPGIKFDLGYISGVIDFKDINGETEILLIESSFYAPLKNKPIRLN